jgi:hypothetical protein
MNKLPAGEYYIGDPCYVIDDWNAFCQIWFSMDEGVMDFDGHDMCVFSTQYGDGCFEASDGTLLGVDAGLIAAVPMVLCTRGEVEDMGAVVTFDKKFQCTRDYDGLLRFGDFSVMTGDEEEEDE